MISTKQLRHGTFAYYPSDMVGQALERFGAWSEPELSFLLSLLGEGDAVVDVGAHIGTFTVPFARKVGPRGGVLAFEAQRLVFQNLVANIFLNELPNVRAENVACGRESYFVNLVEIPGDRARNSGGFAFSPDARHPPSWHTTRVEPLDSLLAGLPRLTLMKIDVEGFEREVLAGARETLGRLHPIVHCECQSEESFAFLKDLAGDLSYRVFAASFDQISQDSPVGEAPHAGIARERDTNALLWPATRPLPVDIATFEVSTFSELRTAPAPSRRPG